MIVLRAVLEEDAYVRSTGELPTDDPPSDWLPWHVQRGRVDATEMGAPGVLLVHEALADAAEDEAFVATALRARAWKDTGYDPDGIFGRVAN